MHVRAYNHDSEFVYTPESEAENSESDYDDLGGQEEIIGCSFIMINREVIAAF